MCEPSCRRSSQQMRSRIEKENLGSVDFDIVLLGADSLQTIKRTHSSYFETTEGGFEQFLGDMLVDA